LILLLAVNPLHLIRQLRANTPAVEKAEPPFQEIIGKNDGVIMAERIVVAFMACFY